MIDPDAALAEMLEIARQHQAELDDESLNQHADTGRLADLVVELHESVDQGGPIPAAWRATAGATPFIGDPFPPTDGHRPSCPKADVPVEPGRTCYYCG